MKKHSHFFPRLVIYILTVLFSVPSFGQTDDVKGAIESISKITASGLRDRTSMLLLEAGFQVPDNLKPAWNSFTAYRKIETAYWSAEKNGNGENFIGFLSKKISSQYESVVYEKSLHKFLAISADRTQQIHFGTLSSLTLPSEVPTEIAHSIGSIVKYTDAKALGGTRGVLKYYFNLPDEDVYKILRGSRNDYDALLSGIKRAQIPPSQKARISNIVSDLQMNFEAASLDKNLTKIKEYPDFVKERPGMALRTSPPKEELKNEYDGFVKKSHPTESSMDFKKMKVNPEGFGGIIFGNQISTSPNIGKLKNIVWIHDNAADSRSKTGELEFIFQDGSQKTFPNVLWEDVYAAYNILYVDNKNAPLGTKQGIGLTGAFYPDVYNEDRVYDGLIKSHKLTVNEEAYYNTVCDLLKQRTSLTNKIKRKSEEKNSLMLKAVMEMRQIDDVLKDIRKAKAERNKSDYLKSVEKGQSLYAQFKKDSTNAIAASKDVTTAFLTYDNVYVKKYNDNQRYWAKKDSNATVNINTYISECNKIILYPVLANLELGRCLIRADVLPRSGSLLLNKIKNNPNDADKIDVCKRWLKGSDSMGWKFTDDALLISVKGDILRVSRKRNPDAYTSQVSILNFNKMTRSKKGLSISTDFPEFNQAMPALTNTFYDYYRLNNFSKVFSVVRWAQQNGATFLNKPQTPPLYAAPAYSMLTKEGTVDLIDR